MIRALSLLLFLPYFNCSAQTNLSVVHKADGEGILYSDFIQTGEDFIGFGNSNGDSWITRFTSETLEIRWANKLSYPPYKVRALELIEMSNSILTLVLVDNTNNGNDFAALVLLHRAVHLQRLYGQIY